MLTYLIYLLVALIPGRVDYRSDHTWRIDGHIVGCSRMEDTPIHPCPIHHHNQETYQ
jgi:hypothetical protein